MTRKDPPVRSEVEPEEKARPSTDDEPVIPVPKVKARQFLNQPAPGFVVEKWLTAKPEMAGKFVLIDFWATWCGPCRESIPDLNALHARFKDQMVFIGVSGENEHDVRRMKSPRIDYPLAVDTQSRMKKAIGVEAIPHAIILDPQGIVRFQGHPGYLTEAGVEKLLAKYSE